MLMTDQRMPGEKGVWLLERARQLRPRILRMLVTAFADMDAAIAAVNSGAIYKYVTKPWDPPQLEMTLRQGLEFFMVQAERDQLLHEKMSVLRNMMIADRIVSLGLLAAGLSHHIRNSLVAVKTFLDLAPIKMAEEKTDLNSLRNPGFLEGISSERPVTDRKNQHPAGRPAHRLGQQSRDAIRRRSPLHEAVGAALESSRTNLPRAKSRWKIRFPIRCPSMRVDKPKFDRLFELLLKDELAMLPAGSRIALTAELQNEGAKPEIVMHISDNGPGLPQEALQRRVRPVRRHRRRAVGIRHQSDGLFFHRPSSRRQN